MKKNKIKKLATYSIGIIIVATISTYNINKIKSKQLENNRIIPLYDEEDNDLVIMTFKSNKEISKEEMYGYFNKDEDNNIIFNDILNNKEYKLYQDYLRDYDVYYTKYNDINYIPSLNEIINDKGIKKVYLDREMDLNYIEEEDNKVLLKRNMSSISHPRYEAVGELKKIEK